ncbi:MAG TPA: hypothetical protein VFQ53_33030 [Kofleriaceae bacterium]|nr:hypothetical protein [Kofleriaceae bacterium]
MTQKKMYKVLSMTPGKNGQTFWSRIGSAFTNKDDSINVHLDLLPMRGDCKFQLRELDEEDLRRRESYANGAPASRYGQPHIAPPAASEASAGDSIPF